MKTKPGTVIDTVVSKLREQARRFNPALETATVVVVWTDEKREWAGVLPNLKSAMPELYSLGEFKPLERTGPGAWLRMMADRPAGDLLPDRVPVLYLPGVANGNLRTDLRSVKDDPQLAPLAELQYRGIFWRQENSKDWTLCAFFESKRAGLGMPVRGDHQTLMALKQALPKLLTRHLATLGSRTVDQAFLDEILNPNPADDVLRWLADPKALQSEKGGRHGQRGDEDPAVGGPTRITPRHGMGHFGARTVGGGAGFARNGGACGVAACDGWLGGPSGDGLGVGGLGSGCSRPDRLGVGASVAP